MGWGYYGFREYVPVARRKANGLKHAAAVAKKQGRELAPVKIEGRKIAKTFWGQSWCDNLEAYSDYENRLPRGATYVRNGSVLDLVIKPRRIEAMVAGSETYTITIDIATLPKATWQRIKQDCTTAIDSLLDLLAGRFSDGVMQRLTRQEGGLFPKPAEIKMKCSCPDSSYCCKHLAAVMYGVGARLDKQPELLFRLREVDPHELVSQAVAEGNLEKELGEDQSAFAGQDLGTIFGIELESTPAKPKGRVRKSSKETVVKEPEQGKLTTTRKTAHKKSAAEEPVIATTAIKLPAAATGKISKAKKPVTKKPATTKIATNKATKKSKLRDVESKQPVAVRSRLVRAK
jgi:uncharacterized Zn finger protein